MQPLGDRWAQLRFWALASIPFFALAAWFWNLGPGLRADDYGLYLLHAQALVEGRPYGDTGYLHTALNFSLSVQAPGLPLVMAAVMKVGGGFHWGAMRLAMTLMAFPFILLSGLYFSRIQSREIGLAVMLVLTVGMATRIPQPESDLGFATLVWGVIFVLDRSSILTWRRVLGCFLLASFAMAYRFVGVALLPTIGLFALVRYRDQGLRLAVPVVAWIAVAGMFLLNGAWSSASGQVSLSFGSVVQGIVPAVRAYSISAAQAHLHPLPWDFGNDVFHGLSLSLAVFGVVAWTKTSWRSAAWLFMASYLVVLVVVTARADRYLIPLYPILVFAWLHGLQTVTRYLRREWPLSRHNRVASGLGASVAAMSLVLVLLHEPRTGGDLTDLPETQALFAYLEELGPRQETRVAFNKARVLVWHTGIEALSLPNGPAAVVLSAFDRLGITHVVMDRLDLVPRPTRRMEGVIEANACRFEPTFDNGSFHVYRLLPDCDRSPS